MEHRILWLYNVRIFDRLDVLPGEIWVKIRVQWASARLCLTVRSGFGIDVRRGKLVWAQPLIGVGRNVSEMRVESEIGRECRSIGWILSIEARLGKGGNFK